MGAKYTEAQKAAIGNYMAKKHVIKVTVDIEKYEEYKAKAEAAGMSLTQYIISKIEA